MNNNAVNKLKWWQLGLISAGVSALGGLAGLVSKKQQKKLYNKELEQAPWAPPSWVYGPAWAINNFFILKALRGIMVKDMPEKRKLLLLQAGIWAVFFSFNYVYFKKKSPLLAAAWTMADFGMAVASIVAAIRKDKKLALNYVPLALWTGFASTLADYQALKNPDPVFKTKPVMN